MKIQIFTDFTGPRLNYTCDVIFNEVLGCEYSVNTERSSIRPDLPVIGYLAHPDDEYKTIPASGLLQEKGLRKFPVPIEIESKKLFPAPPGYFLSHDLFSAVFYLISRYEEFVAKKRDDHSRFPEGNSVLKQNNWHELPLVNIWIEAFGKELTSNFPEFKLRPKEYSFRSTIDVDNPYLFRNKGSWRQTLGGLKLRLKGEKKLLGLRKEVLSGAKKDPYDTFEELNSIHSEFNIRPTFFFLLGDYGPFDKNPSYKNEEYRKLIRDQSAIADVGIHPSYGSFMKPERIVKEVERLKEVTDLEVIKSRQHFLRFQLPETYGDLIDAGIKEEYSMGFSSSFGFRAGIAQPFPYYDLSKETKTELTIVPFMAMDSTVIYNMQIPKEESIEKISEIVKHTKAVKGQFTLLVHNEILSDYGLHEGWGDFYHKAIEIAN